MLNIDVIIYKMFENLPTSLLPPAEETICSLAQLEHATTGYKRERGSAVPVELRESSATARVVPRRSLGARIRGAKRVIMTIDDIKIVNSIAPEDPIPIARNRAVAEVLFQHLAQNCIDCPLEIHCEAREPIAQIARQAQVSTSVPE